MCAYSISNLKYVPIVYRNLCPTKSYNNETFPVIILFTKCSLSNPFFIIIGVNDESSVFAERYHCFSSEAIVFKITTKLDSSLRIIRSKSRKVTVENQFIFFLKSPRFLNLKILKAKTNMKIEANHNLSYAKETFH